MILLSVNMLENKKGRGREREKALVYIITASIYRVFFNLAIFLLKQNRIIAVTIRIR